MIHEFPIPPKPALENPTQLNKDRSSKDLLNTDVSSAHSIPIFSVPFQSEAVQPPERKGKGYTNMDAVRAYEEVIKDNIEYAYLVQDKSID